MTTEELDQVWQDADIDDSIAGKADISFGVPFYTPAPSEDAKKWRRNRVRILPPRADHVDLNGQPSARFYLWVATHYIEEANRYVLCPNRNFEENSCPQCHEANSLNAQGFKDDAKKLWPNWKAIVNVIDLNPDGTLKGDEGDKPQVKVWAISKTLAEELLDNIADLPKEARNITHPINGRDVIVKRQGKGEYSKYQWADEFPDPSPLAAEAMAVLGTMHKLAEVYPRLTAERITALLTAPAASSDPFDDDEDDDDAIVGEVRELPEPKAARKAKPAPEPEEDEDEDDDSPPFDTDEDETPAPAPAKKTRGKAKSEPDPAVEEARRRLQAALAEDDEDDEDEDDD